MTAPEPFRLDRRAVARAFDRAGEKYAAPAKHLLQIGNELLERLQYFRLEPRTIVDLGCGIGLAAQQLRRRFARARVIAVDSAYLMTQQARRRQRFWRRFECVCADAHALPLASHSVDLILSNLMLPWCDDPAAVFAEAQRVLRPGGLLLFSSFGPETLKELRSAWASADSASHVSAFADMTQLAGAMSHAGLAEPVMDRELLRTHYPDVSKLMNELRALGATHAATDRRRSLMGRSRLQAMLGAYESFRTDSGIPASWEVIYGTAFAGSRPSGFADQPDGEYAVPVTAIRPRDPTRDR